MLTCDIRQRGGWQFGLALACCLAPLSGVTKDFYLSNSGLRGQLDLQLAYGLQVRTQDQDDELIAIIAGGTAGGANFDDGNQNYDKGDIVQNMVRATGELALGWHNFGAFFRGYGFYDYENEENDRERTKLSDDALDLVGSDVDLLDAYVSARFDMPQVNWPVLLRLGDQVVSWGESTFFLGGVNITNPINQPLAQQPTGNPRDLRRPLGMLWGSAGLTELFSIEGYYAYDWKKSILSPVGFFHNANDVTAPGRTRVMQGVGQWSDLGTDYDERFGLPPGTLGFDRNSMSIYNIETDRPSDQGQWGISLQGVFPQLNDANLGVYFANYHWQTEVLSARIPDADVIESKYSPEVIAENARKLQTEVPSLSDEEALTTATFVEFAKYPKDLQGITEYPENIKMMGLSFNTTTIRTGTALSAEISHQLDVPLLIAGYEVAAALLSGNPSSPLTPTLADNQITNGRTGQPGELIKGFIERDKTQLVFGLTQLLGARFGASQIGIAGEIGWLHIHNMPSKNTLRIDAPGVTLSGNENYEGTIAFPPGYKAEDSDDFADTDSWGYRLAGSMTYRSVFGGLTLRPRVIWRHDVGGNSPANLGPFLEDRKVVTLGLGASYLSDTLTGDLSYTNSFGAGRHNTLNDRDFVSFTVRFNY